MPTVIISKQLVIIGICGVLVAWFLLDQRTSFIEKIGIIFTMILLYVALRYFSGASVEDILAPILKK